MLQVFLSSLATTWLIVAFYPASDNSTPYYNRAMANSDHLPPSNQSPQFISRSAIADGPTEALSPPAEDIIGLMKWKRIKKREITINDEFIVPAYEYANGLARYSGSISNNGHDVISGIEFEITILQCSITRPNKQKCRKVSKPTNETIIGKIFRPQNIDHVYLNLPFHGPLNDHKIKVRIKRVAHWHGPTLTSDRIILSRNYTGGYLEINVSNIDTSATCAISTEAKTEHKGC